MEEHTVDVLIVTLGGGGLLRARLGGWGTEDRVGALFSPRSLEVIKKKDKLQTLSAPSI